MTKTKTSKKKIAKPQKAPGLTTAEEERAAQAKLRHMARMRKAAAKKRAQVKAKKEQHRTDYREWLGEEKDAFEAHRKNPTDVKLLKEWRATWHREPQFKKPENETE
jgi:hypothetical protein